MVGFYIKSPFQRNLELKRPFIEERRCDFTTLLHAYSTPGTTGMIPSQPGPQPEGEPPRAGLPHRHAAVRRGSPVPQGSPVPRGAGIRSNTSLVRVTQHMELWPLRGSHSHQSPATSHSLPVTGFQLFPQLHSSAGHLTSVQHPYHPLSLCSVFKTFSGFPKGTTEVKCTESLGRRTGRQLFP